MTTHPRAGELNHDLNGKDADKRSRVYLHPDHERDYGNDFILKAAPVSSRTNSTSNG